MDQIKLDPGFPGTLETSLVEEGIPAITLELGGPRGFDPELTKGGVEGVMNVLAHYGVVDQPVGRTAEDMGVYRGNALASVSAVTGGFVTYLVSLNDTVEEGQAVAIQRNGFGEEVHRYTAPASGRVAIQGTDAIRERGSEIVTILYTQPTCPEEGCPYYGAE